MNWGRTTQHFTYAELQIIQQWGSAYLLTNTRIPMDEQTWNKLRNYMLALERPT